MYAHLLLKAKQLYPQAPDALLQNTLLMVALLLDQKTANLYRLKDAVGRLLGNTTTQPESHYQRLKRFLWQGKAQDRLWIAILRAALGLLTGQSRYLILDGSSWQAGGYSYHFLTLSLLYQGVSVPLFWLDLDRSGHSQQWHRCLLLRLAGRLLPLRGKVLLGDREYIGSEWFKYLQQAGIGLVIRLRAIDYVADITSGGQSMPLLEARARARPYQAVSQCFTLGEHRYRFVILHWRNRAGQWEYLRLITSLSGRAAVEAYKLRYRIESMFRHLKSNGFQWEELGVRRVYKVQLMMALLVLAYTLAVVEGLLSVKATGQAGKVKPRRVSVFRRGLAGWQNHLGDLNAFIVKLLYVIRDCKIDIYKLNLGHVP